MMVYQPCRRWRFGRSRWAKAICNIPLCILQSNSKEKTSEALKEWRLWYIILSVLSFSWKLQMYLGFAPMALIYIRKDLQSCTNEFQCQKGEGYWLFIDVLAHDVMLQCRNWHFYYLKKAKYFVCILPHKFSTASFKSKSSQQSFLIPCTDWHV